MRYTIWRQLKQTSLLITEASFSFLNVFRYIRTFLESNRLSLNDISRAIVADFCYGFVQQVQRLIELFITLRCNGNRNYLIALSIVVIEALKCRISFIYREDLHTTFYDGFYQFVRNMKSVIAILYKMVRLPRRSITVATRTDPEKNETAAHCQLQVPRTNLTRRTYATEYSGNAKSDLSANCVSLNAFMVSTVDRFYMIRPLLYSIVNLSCTIRNVQKSEANCIGTGWGAWVVMFVADCVACTLSENIASGKFKEPITLHGHNTIDESRRDLLQEKKEFASNSNNMPPYFCNGASQWEVLRYRRMLIIWNFFKRPFFNIFFKKALTDLCTPGGFFDGIPLLGGTMKQYMKHYLSLLDLSWFITSY